VNMSDYSITPVELRLSGPYEIDPEITRTSEGGPLPNWILLMNTNIRFLLIKPLPICLSQEIPLSDTTYQHYALITLCIRLEFPAVLSFRTNLTTYLRTWLETYPGTNTGS